MGSLSVPSSSFRSQRFCRLSISFCAGCRLRLFDFDLEYCSETATTHCSAVYCPDSLAERKRRMDLPALPGLPFNSGRGVREYLLAVATTSAAFAFVSASLSAASFLILCSSLCAAAASSSATALAISDRCSCMLRRRGVGDCSLRTLSASSRSSDCAGLGATGCGLRGNAASRCDCHASVVSGSTSLQVVQGTLSHSEPPAAKPCMMSRHGRRSLMRVPPTLVAGWIVSAPRDACAYAMSFFARCGSCTNGKARACQSIVCPTVVIIAWWTRGSRR